MHIEIHDCIEAFLELKPTQNPTTCMISLIRYTQKLKHFRIPKFNFWKLKNMSLM